MTPRWARQREQFIDPAIKSSAAETIYSYRVSKVAGLHTLAERLAEGQHWRHRIQWARRRGQFEEATRLLNSAQIYADATTGSFYDLAERNQGLIDLNEVRGFIKIGVKDWLASGARAIAAKEDTT